MDDQETPKQETTELWVMRNGQLHLLVQEIDGDEIPDRPRFTKEDWIRLYRARRLQGFPLTKKEIEHMQHIALEILAADNQAEGTDTFHSASHDANDLQT